MAKNLELRPLSEDELRADYLPLRKDILQEELGWTIVQAETPADMLDKYDEYSEQLGLFWNTTMIGGVRLVVAETLEELPSARFLTEAETNWKSGRFAEISRLMVKPAFRRHGLMRVLICDALATARRLGIENVIISVARRDDLKRLLSDFGFRTIRSGFSYHDSRIRPTVIAATFQLHAAQTMTESLESHLGRIENAIASSEASFDPLKGPGEFK